jgi:phosphopantetheinyl transferase/acyl carrier protein
MNAFGSMVCDSSAMPVFSTAECPLGLLPESARAVCCRLDAFPCEPNLLADLILSSGERHQWMSMHAVDKRRHEWLLGRCAAKDAVRRLLAKYSAEYSNVQLSPREIEIVPDSYGCPRVEGAAIAPEVRPALSIAHSQGVAVALAALDPGLIVGIDLESLSRRRENYEAIAFHPDERSLLETLPWDLREEWALRMWCAKEAAGKALGRGLSAGLLAFHITRLETAGGGIELQLRGSALEQFPWSRDRMLTIYTARESNFVFSAIIYQQGAVRMRPSRQEILDYLLHKMSELTADWDYPDPVRPESRLFGELGFESLDAVVLCTAIQEHYQTPMPFAELLAEIGQQQRDLSIGELTDFVDTHLGPPAAADRAIRRVQ